jgi:hypothetical protein
MPVPGVMNVSRDRQERLVLTRRPGLLAKEIRMNWAIGLLSIGAVVLGTALDRRRLRERQRLPRPEIQRWEEEGGAVPASGARTAAQTARTP